MTKATKHVYISLSKPGAYNETFWTSGNSEGFWILDYHWDSTGRFYKQYFANLANGFGGRECIFLSHERDFKWDTIYCDSDKMRYICEQKGKRA